MTGQITPTPSASPGSTGSTLRRDLGLFGAVAVSLAVMGPSMSVSLNPQAIAEQVGGAVPVVYVIAALPLLVIAFAFVVLTRRHGSAGSLYGLVGLELGPRAGVVSGLWLAVAYAAATAVTTISFGIFGIGLITQITGATPADAWTYVVAAGGLALAIAIAMRPARGIGRLLLGMEGLTMGLILVTVALVLARLLRDGGPQGQTVDFADFSLTGVSTGALGLALTFAILSSVGFEGAAAAGEETRDPLRNIPRALVLTAVLSTVFYVIVTAIGVWGFGTQPNQIEAFVASASLPGDIATTYVAAWLGDLITLGGAVSSLACMIAAQVAGGRMLYAYGRDGVLPRSLGTLAPRWETPVRAGVVIAIAGATLVALATIPASGVSFQVFEAVSDYTGIVVLAAYAAACVAAATVLLRDRGPRRILAAIPILGVIVVAGIFILSLFPLPSGWELVAPLSGVVTIVVVAAAGVALTRRGRHVTITEESADSA